MSWLTMRQESDCFLLPRKTILVVSHASRCLFLVCYSKEKIDSANGLGFTYLYLCRKSAHWHSSIFKIGTVGKPAILEKWKICKLWRALGAHLATRPGRTATLQKRDSTTPRYNANPWKRRKRSWWARLNARVLHYTIILGRGVL